MNEGPISIGGCVVAMVVACVCSSCNIMEPGRVTETTLRSETYKPRTFEQLDGFFKDGHIPGDTIKWQDDASAKGEPEIVIDKKKQMGYFYRGDQLMGYFPVCTGKHSVSTPEGEFKILIKVSEHRSCFGQFVSKETGKVMNGDADIRVQAVPAGQTFIPAEMPFFMRIKDTVGIHQGYLPGKPSSHGCIRVPDLVAAKLFNATPVGTRVTIKGDLGREFFVQRDAQKAARLAAAKQAAAVAAAAASDSKKSAESPSEGGSPVAVPSVTPAPVSAPVPTPSEQKAADGAQPAPASAPGAPSVPAEPEAKSSSVPASQNEAVSAPVVVPVTASDADEPAATGRPQPLDAPSI